MFNSPSKLESTSKNWAAVVVAAWFVVTKLKHALPTKKTITANDNGRGRFDFCFTIGRAKTKTVGNDNDYD